MGGWREKTRLAFRRARLCAYVMARMRRLVPSAPPPIVSSAPAAGRQHQPPHYFDLISALPHLRLTPSGSTTSLPQLSSVTSPPHPQVARQQRVMLMLCLAWLPVNQPAFAPVREMHSDHDSLTAFLSYWGLKTNAIEAATRAPPCSPAPSACSLLPPR